MTPGTPNFQVLTPGENSLERRWEVAQGAANSFALRSSRKCNLRFETMRVELDVSQNENEAVTKAMEMLKAYTDYPLYVSLCAEWLIKRSSTSGSFKHFVSFLADCVNLTPSINPPAEIPMKRTKSTENVIDNRDVLEDFWSGELLTELLGPKPPQTDRKFEIEPQLIRADLLFRILHLVYEEISTYSRLIKETRLLRDFLANLANSMNFKEGETYFRSLAKTNVPSDLPNLTSTLSNLILGGC